MSMGDFVAKMKELNMTPESMGSLMGDPEAGFKFLESANPDAKVGSFLKGVVEIQNLEGSGVSPKGHKMMTGMFDLANRSGSTIRADDADDIYKHLSLIHI